MSKGKIISFVSLVIVSAVLLILCLHFAGVASENFTYVTQQNLNLSSSAEPLTIGSLCAISHRLFPRSYSFACECEETLIAGESVVPVLTTFSYHSLLGKKLQGEGITEEDEASGKRVAIISEDLAVKLFFNTDCIGKTLVMNSQEFTIVGIYQTPESPVESLSADGAERVYIPYTCAENSSGRVIGTLVYDNASTAPVIEQMNLRAYHPTDLHEKESVIRNFPHIAGFVLFAGLCVVCFHVWKSVCAKLTAEIRSDLSKHYFPQSLRAVPLKYLSLVIVGVGVPALLLFIFASSDFSIYIAEKYIPNDNLFDVAYYVNSVRDNAVYMNSLSLTGDTFLPVLYERVFSLLVWLTGLFALNFCFAVHSGVGILKEILLNKLNPEA